MFVSSAAKCLTEVASIVIGARNILERYASSLKVTLSSAMIEYKIFHTLQKFLIVVLFKQVIYRGINNVYNLDK